jgi:hypothetical protein
MLFSLGGTDFGAVTLVLQERKIAARQTLQFFRRHVDADVAGVVSMTLSACDAVAAIRRC